MVRSQVLDAVGLVFVAFTIACGQQPGPVSGVAPAPSSEVAAGPLLTFDAGAARAVVAKEGDQVWESAPDGYRTPLPRRVRGAAWFRGAGRYSLRVEVAEEKAAVRRLTADFEVPASAQEVRVDLERHLDSGADEQQPFASAFLDLRIRILQPAPDTVALRAMPPTGESGGVQDPVFELSNGSADTLYGNGIWNRFDGYFECKRGDDWLLVERGGCCGTVETGKPLNPGAATVSTECAFITSPAPLDPALEYRYVVRYTTQDLGWGLPTDEIRDGGSRVDVINLFEVTVPYPVPAGD